MSLFSSPRVVASFAAIYLIWGSTFLAIRWAVETIPPFPMMALRCLVGGGILLALSRLREPGSAWPTGRQWLGAATVGMFLFVGCHGLLAREEQHVPSGVAALFLATIPLFVPLLAWGLTGSGRPSARTTGALVAGFGGVALLVAVQGSGSGGVSVTDGGLLLLTAFSWAAGTIATRVLPMPASPLAAAAAPLLAGSVALAAISLATGEAGDVSVSAISGRSLLGLGYLVVMGTVVTFAAYVWLLRDVPPTRVATYAFVNPAVAVLLGWAIAGESLSAGTLLATALIIVAVAAAVSDNAASPSRRRAMTDSAEPVSPCADRVAGETL
jgi:drug/metabolite transporter (DMT)-like permease